MASGAVSGCLVFISHSSADAAIARELSVELTAHGHQAVFLDCDAESGITAGTEWERVLYSRLRAASALIALWSRSAGTSRWVFAELAIARLLGKPLCPICLDEATLPPPLSQQQALYWSATCVRQLLCGLENQGITPRPRVSNRTPYPGLLCFEEADAGLFLGRSGESARVYE